jgi:hypothetical protein
VRNSILAAAVMTALAPMAAMAQSPREMLVQAAFQANDKQVALADVTRAIAASETILATRPNDREALLQRAVGIGYRAKLTRNRKDAQTSRRMFESLAAADPRDPEAQMVLAGWHLDAVNQLGGMIARSILGARAPIGNEALDRSVELSGGRAFFTGLAALMRIRQDDDDVVRARQLAEAAATGSTPTPLDRLMKRSALAILPALRANDGKAAAAIARKLLPFGRIAT